MLNNLSHLSLPSLNIYFYMTTNTAYTQDATFFYIADQKQAHKSRAGMDCGKLTFFYFYRR